MSAPRSLRNVTTEQLEAELARRKVEEKPSRPKPKANPDFSGLIAWLEVEFEKRARSQDADQGPVIDEDGLRDAVYEDVIDTVYGREFWEWAKNNPW